MTRFSTRARIAVWTWLKRMVPAWRIVGVVIPLGFGAEYLPPPFDVFSFKLMMILTAAGVCYWLDYELFPKSRPVDLIPNFEGESKWTEAEARVFMAASMRMILFVASGMIAVAMGQ